MKLKKALPVMKGCSFVLRASAVAFLGIVATVSGANLVVNGDFSAGNTGFTTGYTLSTQTPQLFANGIHGIYAVLPIGSVAGQSAYGDWTNVTVDPNGGNGNVFASDAATTANTPVWSETVAVQANTLYTFSYYAAEISNPGGSNAVFQPMINGTNGAALTVNGSWQEGTYTWNSGSSTTATLSLTDTNTSGPYNDFVLTDIALTGPAAGSTAPEPATLALLGAGLATVASVRKFRKGNE